MAILDLVSSVVSRPAGRLVEGTVRELVSQVVRDHDLASTADIQAIRRELESARLQVKTLDERVAAAEKSLGDMRQELLDTLGRAQTAEGNLARALASLEESRQALDAARAQVQAPPPPPAAVADPELPLQLQGINERALSAPVEAAPAQAPSEPEAAPAEDDASRTRAVRSPLACRVTGCEGAHRSKGFCSPHYQQWRRGTLAGFVSPEGLVKDGNRTYRVDPNHAGLPYTAYGRSSDRKIRVDGHPVDATLLP